jgi:uncharacterized protein YdaL
VSADDFEFYLAHVDKGNNVVIDGPTPVDSAAWARGRVQAGLAEFEKAGLTAPTIFEFPHYAGSTIDYATIRETFAVRYERAFYFNGLLKGGPVSYATPIGQYFPYVVTDYYGSLVIPENLGNYEPVPFNNRPPRLPADMIKSAKLNLVVRDGFASFFFHPYAKIEALKETVAGIKALGYTFVGAPSLVPP